MCCKDCKYFQKFYIYSKEKGFVYVGKGNCLKNVQLQTNNCGVFEEIEMKDSVDFENVVIDFERRFEELNAQIKELIELYKTKENSCYEIKDNLEDRTKLIFR